MKAMVLAAGKGSRLGQLTATQPKPMMRIGGMPILERNVRLLVEHGFKDLVINLHCLPDVITQYFANGARFGASITYSYEQELLGTAGALRRVESYFDDDFLVLYGDNITTCDLSALMRWHRKSGAKLTVGVFERPDPLSSGIVELDSDGRIIRFLEKPRPDEAFSCWVSAGILAVAVAAMKYIPERMPSDFGRDVIPGLISSGEPVYGYRMKEPSWWIDTPEDYDRTRRAFESGRARM
jgi:NDP-sugar pyrophosphorylase family protein